jgi:hypothetical protein
MICVQKPWVNDFSIASLVLIVASLISVTLRSFLRHEPELLKISSWATRDHEHMKLPTTRTGLEATERARLMNDARMRLGDVGVGDGVGRIKIRTVSDDGEENEGICRSPHPCGTVAH